MFNPHASIIHFYNKVFESHLCKYIFTTPLPSTQSGGLQFLQELNETVGGKLTEFIVQINNCYPPEVVEYYSPQYSKTLLQKIDEYQPSA